MHCPDSCTSVRTALFQNSQKSVSFSYQVNRKSSYIFRWFYLLVKFSKRSDKSVTTYKQSRLLIKIFWTWIPNFHKVLDVKSEGSIGIISKKEGDKQSEMFTKSKVNYKEKGVKWAQNMQSEQQSKQFVGEKNRESLSENLHGHSWKLGWKLILCSRRPIFFQTFFFDFISAFF